MEVLFLSPCQSKGTVAFAVDCSSVRSLFALKNEVWCRAPPSELEILQISRISEEQEDVLRFKRKWFENQKAQKEE